MPVDYSYGKIYKITSASRGICYIGSTVQSLSLRMVGHRNDYKQWQKTGKKYMTSFEVLECGDAKIELIKKYPCNNRKELQKGEGEEMKKIDCVNARIAGRTKEEYREKNKKKINKKHAEYYQKNKEKVKKKDARYYQKNKEKLLKQKGEKITCCCGSIISRGNKSKHERTLKHLNAFKVFTDDNSFVYIY